MTFDREQHGVKSMDDRPVLIKSSKIARGSSLLPRRVSLALNTQTVSYNYTFADWSQHALYSYMTDPS